MERKLLRKAFTPLRLIAILTTFAVSSMAQAVVIEFDSIASYNTVVGGDAIPVAGSVITDQFASDGVIFGRTGVSAGVAVVRGTLAPSSGLNSVAGLDAAGIIPGAGDGGALGDIYFNFLGVTDAVSFTVGDGGGDTDIFDIRAYDASDALVFNNHYENASRFPVAFGGFDIARVEVDFTGAFGYSLDDLTFNTVKQVPEPASLALLSLGLAGIGLTARRKNRKQNS
jgi:hypothetical protein